jgi:hypothetical protein
LVAKKRGGYDCKEMEERRETRDADAASYILGLASGSKCL